MSAIRRATWGAAVLSGFVACAGTTPREPAAALPGRVASGEQGIAFRFTATDGGELSHRTTRGRATALLFLTTYDPASQVQAKTLEQVLHTHRPRANGGAIMLEPPAYGVLADVFRSTLALSYPVALADPATLDGSGAFGSIDRVPTTVVLDRQGRVVYRKSGLASAAELEEALSGASR